ncbi:MAG: phage head spike fiber domain-containing protein, partial [Alphaproteobacteria bacterium]
MSYSNSFPSVRPTTFDFANSGKLDSRISYTRSSTGTAFSAERHKSSENLIPYSNDLSQSAWTKSRVNVPSTNNTAPDGTATASSVLEDTSTDSHTFYDNFNCVSGQQYSFVYYFKANGRTKLSISPQATATIATVQFDLTAATSTVLSGSADSHSITAIGSTGWYKCALTVTATATGTGYSQVNLRDASGNSSYTGDVTKGIFAWGASVASTGQTVVNQTSGQIHRSFAPTLKTSQIDQPRFEYSATDGQSVAKGLLIEQQFTQ